MLPQIDAHTLSSNSQFARLHKDLCTNKLQRNGTTQIAELRVVKEQDKFTKVGLDTELYSFLSMYKLPVSHFVLLPPSSHTSFDS